MTTTGTILITGPTGDLGRSAVLAMARRPAEQRPDLLLLGRPGSRLEDTAAQARAAGATVREIACDLSSLAAVHGAAEQARKLLGSGEVRPLRGLVANAGLTVADTRRASADGYELTFAVNYLAHAQLAGDLLDLFAAPARIVLTGSNTYYANWVRRLLGVPAAEWKDPVDLARPAGPGVAPTLKASGVAYSNSKLAILYYAHELQRRAPGGISVAVFKPGVHARHGTEPGGALLDAGDGPGTATTAGPRRHLARHVGARSRVRGPRRALGPPARRRLRPGRPRTPNPARSGRPGTGAPPVGRHAGTAERRRVTAGPGTPSRRRWRRRRGSWSPG